MSSHLDHDAPLRALVAQLGGGRSLRERVIALRYRRRRPSAGQAGGDAGSGCSAAGAGQPGPLGGESSADTMGTDGEIPVEAEREVDHTASSLAVKNGTVPANLGGGNDAAASEEGEVGG